MRPPRLARYVPDAPLRILVFDLPPLLGDLVQDALDAKDGITSVRAGAGELEQAVATERPHAVIVPLEEAQLLAESRRFLEERTRVRLLGISLRDGRAVLYELRPNRAELGEVSPDELADVVCKAVAQKVRV